MMDATNVFRLDPPTLRGSRDDVSGQVYFPPRALSADGELRDCVPVDLSPEGTLYSFTRMGDTWYGQIDLPEKVRIQCVLGPGPREIGAHYRLAASPQDGDSRPNTGWWFVGA
jgi:uncharacterized OB-fold protein